MISRRQNLQPNSQNLSLSKTFGPYDKARRRIKKTRKKKNKMKHEMRNIKPRWITLFFLLFGLLLGNCAVQASRARVIADTVSLPSQIHRLNLRRLMIGSTAPTCTYNECRGCRYKCRAEQVPVEGNDPINSAYHYRCVCHR
ncbi:hypothetical protein EUTSA_v10026516mg [Eutrema salsugineum]|uniref:Stomagen C-terminal domain-containing protein n=1 Tax=Eutrema salsugineum TaxID=72664 RepID=V4P9S8_EUTSA|nr:EPIDERMAL PATTERNING FACTOR-like protein 9 [Eutrema salsugineum]ESQ56436.1 hypothetical protein EUTSA_v10026516mg [Eutrema salsugineum]